MKEDGQREEAAVLGVAVAAEPPPDPLEAVLDPGLQMQMERLLIEEHALEQQKAFTSGPPEATAFDQHARQRLLRAELPEYLLDFGYVVLGNTPTHVVRITNTGQFPASFRTDRRVLRDTGMQRCSVGLFLVPMMFHVPGSIEVFNKQQQQQSAASRERSTQPLYSPRPHDFSKKSSRFRGGSW
ncbi:hydrocephalus-inducing protein homolog isoform X1 [Athene noctua]|uniref:hydrocephalus-inducing protein homolog isoform X1 n=1 Tax=Athene noctua TaxID=126797 RepID=UPI003EBAD258